MHTLIKLIHKYSPKNEYAPKTKYYLCVRIKFTNGTTKWYRLSPKIANAANQYKMLNGTLPYSILINSIINVPITPYFSENKAVITVGQIKKIKYKRVKSTMLCTRSQFIPKKSLKHNFKRNYVYLRHDYGRYSRFNIWINLRQFTQEA